MNARILLTGATGFLGHYLAEEFHSQEVELLAPTRADLDLTDAATLTDRAASFRPDVILHNAALSRMGVCEDDPELAHTVNALSTRALAEAAPRLLLVSTDLVFEGTAAPYRSSDVPTPISAYGRSKAAAESELAGPTPHLVVRIPLLFGPSWNGAAGATDMILSALRDDRPLTLYDNEFRTPLHAAVAARHLVDLALDATRTGSLHLAGPERVSRFELGERFARLNELPLDHIGRTSCESPIRPRDVSMVSDVSIQESLDEMLTTT